MLSVPYFADRLGRCWNFNIKMKTARNEESDLRLHGRFGLECGYTGDETDAQRFLH